MVEHKGTDSATWDEMGRWLAATHPDVFRAILASIHHYSACKEKLNKELAPPVR